MAQLIMKWENDKTARKGIFIPNDVSIKTFPEIENAVSEWLAIEGYIGWGENPEPITDGKYNYYL